ncbi:hypothetical protein [Paenibacillus lautus]|nr:hypothetical protein [Paenibacillus lautus]MEC0256828.1 hypothetical protein [Paenibacillus lautus]
MLAANSVVVMGWEFMQVDILVENMVSAVIPVHILVGDMVLASMPVAI